MDEATIAAKIIGGTFFFMLGVIIALISILRYR